MARRYKVTLRKNGAVCGEAVYATKGEALSAAANMQGAASGLEAIVSQIEDIRAKANPRKRLPRPTDVQTLLIPKSAFTVAQAKAWAKKHGFKFGSVDEGGPRAGMHRLRQHDPSDYTAGTFRTISLGDGVEAVIGMPKKGAVGGPHPIKVHRKGYERHGYTTKRGTRVGPTHVAPTVFEEIGGYGSRGVQRRNPSIGRGTKHRDIVAEAIAKKLRAEGVKKAEATSRGFAIATAAERRRRNPTPIDIASLDFSHFKKVTKIDGFYNVRSGRRFARVMSKDESFVTDVPVTDGGGPTPHKVKGADAIKRRAYEQLRIHIQPTKWKPSVRVNPGTGRVPYKGAVIKIESGTYTVEPHGATFSGPDGFVSAKKWIEKNT